MFEFGRSALGVLFRHCELQRLGINVVEFAQEDPAIAKYCRKSVVLWRGSDTSVDWLSCMQTLNDLNLSLLFEEGNKDFSSLFLLLMLERCTIMFINANDDLHPLSATPELNWYTHICNFLTPRQEQRRVRFCVDLCQQATDNEDLFR